MSPSPPGDGRSRPEGPLGFGPDPEDARGRARGPRDGSPPGAGWPARPEGSGAGSPERRQGSATSAAAPRVRLPGAEGRQGWLVGIAAVLLVVVVGLSTLGGDRPGAAGLGVGDAAPPFAAPLATSALEGDVNVATPQTVGKSTGRVPACELRRPDVLNACALWERGPLALAFFSERSQECVGELDRLDAAARRRPGVAVAAVAIRGDRGDLRDLVRARGWRMPVGVDRDGILADLYGVAVCPQVAFLERGGRVRSTSVGTSSAAALDRALAGLAG